MKNKICFTGHFTAVVLGMILFVSNLLGANPSDAQATQPASAEGVYTPSWTWNTPCQLNGWTAKNANSCEVLGEGLKINTGSDFNLISPVINVDARIYRYVTFQLKSDLGDRGEIFFLPEGQKEFSPQFSVPFQIIGDNEFHTYLVDMTKNMKWLGQINRLRLDAVNRLGINIQIKEFSLLEKPDAQKNYVQLGLYSVFLHLAGSSSEIRVNSEEQFFNALNMDLAGMEAVKAAVVAKDWPAAKKALLEHMRNRTTPRYIVDRHDKARYVEQAKKEFPGSAIEGAIKNADQICDHDFTFEGFRHKFDGPVVWYNTKSGMPFVYSARLNRMLYLSDIGRAYWLTGNSKYANAACELLDSWINSSPMPFEIRRVWRKPVDEACAPGNPWGQTLGVAQRLTGWTAFNEYFVDSPEVTPEFYYRFLVSLLEQARYIYAIEGLGFCGGNWPIVECSGLAQVAIMFPEFKESPKWWTRVKQLTRLQMQNTVLPDGVQIERSPGYHSWCYIQFNNLLLLATLNNIELPKGFAQLVQAMYEYLHYKIAYPDRKGFPAMADGSGVSWWSENKNGAATGNLKSDLNLSNFWDIGLKPYEALKKFEKTTPPYTSTELTSAGFYMMRSGWGDKDRFLLFDCATPSNADAHWHDSALNVDIYAFGRPLIVDPGLLGYSSYSYLDYFRRVRAHNIIELSSEENRKDPKLVRWLRSRKFCFAEGTVACPFGSEMTRKVLFVDSDYWIVDDFVQIGSAVWNPCVTRAYWHLNSKSVVFDGQHVQLASADDEGYTRRSWKSGNGKDLSFYTDDADTGNILVIPDGNIDRFTLCNDTPCKGYVASYRQIVTPPADMKIRYTTLLYPFEGTKRPDVSFKDGVVKIGQNREGLYMRKGERTDGDCAFVGKEDGAINRILLVAGSRISDAVQLDVSADFMIVTQQGESLDIQLMEGSSKKVNRIELSGLQGVNKVTVNGKPCKVSAADGKLVIVGPFEKISPNPDNPDLFWIVK